MNPFTSFVPAFHSFFFCFFFLSIFNLSRLLISLVRFNFFLLYFCCICLDCEIGNENENTNKLHSSKNLFNLINLTKRVKKLNFLANRQKYQWYAKTKTQNTSKYKTLTLSNTTNFNVYRVHDSTKKSTNENSNVSSFDLKQNAMEQESSLSSQSNAINFCPTQQTKNVINPFTATEMLKRMINRTKLFSSKPNTIQLSSSLSFMNKDFYNNSSHSLIRENVRNSAIEEITRKMAKLRLHAQSYGSDVWSRLLLLN